MLIFGPSTTSAEVDSKLSTAVGMFSNYLIRHHQAYSIQPSSGLCTSTETSIL